MVFLCWSDDIGDVAATDYVRVCVWERYISGDLFGSLFPYLLLPLQYKDHLYLSNLSSNVVEIPVIVELNSFTFLSWPYSLKVLWPGTLGAPVSSLAKWEILIPVAKSKMGGLAVL